MSGSLKRGESFLNQDLTDWLSGNYTSPQHEKNSEGTGLLLAPISNTQPQLDFSKFDLTPPENFSKPALDFAVTPEIEVAQEFKPEPENSKEQDIKTPEPEIKHEPDFAQEQEIIQEQIPESKIENEDAQKLTPEVEQEVEPEIKQEQEPEHEHENDNEPLPDDDSEDEFNIEKTYRQKLTDPPDELWTDIAEPDNSFKAQVEDSELKRNNKFINRLQKVLQGRRTKAAEEKEHEIKHKVSYVPRIIFLCVFMLITLAGAWGVLFFLERNTPEALNSRAEKLFEQNEFDEAMNLYQKAYKIYPSENSLLTGLAKSAEKAGKIQTASVALNEYLKLLPLDKKEERQTILKELERLNGNNENKSPQQPQPTQTQIQVQPKIETPPPPPTPNLNAQFKSNDIKYNYELLIKEGSKNLIYKHYDLAMNNFFEALRLKNNDVRAWLGLAEAYKGKGLKSDALRILQNAYVIFGTNPTIEMALRFLNQQY